MKKIILIALLMVVAWHFALLLSPDLSAPDSDYRKNRLKAEKYIYDIPTPEKVILGSSLANRIEPEGFYNLAMAGMSIFEGYTILEMKNDFPKEVYIETNVLYRGINRSFQEDIGKQITHLANNYTPIFRADKKPIALFTKELQPISRRLSTYWMRFVKRILPPLSQEEATTLQPKSNAFETSLDLQRKKYSSIPNERVLNESFEELNKIIVDLKDKGADVYLFEMPIYPELVDSYLSRYIRNEIDRRFPNVNKIPLPKDFASYQTSDVLHLNKEDVVKYNQYIENISNRQ